MPPDIVRLIDMMQRGTGRNRVERVRISAKGEDGGLHVARRHLALEVQHLHAPRGYGAGQQF